MEGCQENMNNASNVINQSIAIPVTDAIVDQSPPNPKNQGHTSTHGLPAHDENHSKIEGNQNLEKGAYPNPFASDSFNPTPIVISYEIQGNVAEENAENGGTLSRKRPAPEESDNSSYESDDSDGESDNSDNSYISDSDDDDDASDHSSHQPKYVIQRKHAICINVWNPEMEERARQRKMVEAKEQFCHDY
ncbi:hypothetical protein M5689_012694 [Euphorbia peplus]|nr:hypothetical protein M5689_012694 [Euphorbia peplus]